jgi:RND superfamily putative drug exporter
LVLERFGRGCARRRWIVVVAWAVIIVGVVAAGVAFGGQADNALTIPGASSEEALDVLEEEFPEAAGASATVVFHTTDPGTTVTDTSIEADIESSITAIKALADVELVTDPFTTSGSVSSDGRTAVATVLYTNPQADLPDNGISTFDDLQDAIEPYRSSTLEVELGGALASTQPVGIEDIYVLYGLLVALAILLVTLGTWWSFAWPVLGALAGVGLGTGLLALLQDIVSMPTISGTVGVMVGLGVGIDYGLFVCSRYKDAVAEGCDPREAAGRALSTSGRAVLTAGATVLVALLALLVFDVPAVSAMAYAVVIFVTCAILAAVTLQPAICALVGRRITHGHVPFVRAQRSESPDATPRALGLRWAGFVTRWAAPVAVVGFVVLLVLAAPVYSGQFRLGPLDNSLYPTSSTQYKANELQASEFGAGSTDPLLIVTEIASDDSSASSQLDSLISAIEGTTGVAAVSSAETNAAGDLAIFEVTPTTDAQDEATAELVDRLRDDTIPTATSGTGLTALVSGTTAVFADLDTRIADRLVLFIALVILLAMLILAVAFRSILIPLKAATLNILTILATYGVLVAVFTEGWGLSVLGVPSEVPILSLLAPVIFAVLFGLSNDYEVYLVNRMREQYQETGDARRAVVLGHGRGSRIVIAAALVMIFVFVSYVLQPSTPVKQFGFGMTVAILIDCFVTRMAILPALMRLGGAAMWFPGLRTRASHRDTGSSS